MKKLLVICGPTATGKTALAILLARQFNGELVSADSRQVYKTMDIGTGKDLPKSAHVADLLDVTWRNQTYTLPAYEIAPKVLIWMYDVVAPDEPFSVAHYEACANRVLTHIWDRQKLPIIVGGTGLYILSLLHVIETTAIPPDQALRKRLELFSLRQLQSELASIDTNVWNTLNKSDRNNPRRLIRKIEIAQVKMGKKRQLRKSKMAHDSLVVGLRCPSDILQQKIAKRVRARMNEKFFQEISKLHTLYSWDLPSMSGLGYRIWEPYFSKNNPNQSDMRKILDRWISDECAYVKRQMTWFKRFDTVQWHDVTKKRYYKDIVAQVCTWYTKGNSV